MWNLVGSTNEDVRYFNCNLFGLVRQQDHKSCGFFCNLEGGEGRFKVTNVGAAADYVKEKRPTTGRAQSAVKQAARYLFIFDNCA